MDRARNYSPLGRTDSVMDVSDILSRAIERLAVEIFASRSHRILIQKCEMTCKINFS